MVGHTSGKRATRDWEPADQTGTTVQQRAIHDGIDGRVQALLSALVSAST
jgi:hypothetical protein